MINREQQIFVPFMQLLQTLKGDGAFATVVRRWEMWTEVPPESQPWLCLSDRPVEKGEQQTPGTPAKWTMALDLYIYARVVKPASRSEVLNPLIDKVTNLIDWVPPEGKQTLGGKVHWVKLDGEIHKTGGIMEEQAVAIIPVSVILAGAPFGGITT